MNSIQLCLVRDVSEMNLVSSRTCPARLHGLGGLEQGMAWLKEY